ncbi:MAG: hypothetical protein AAF483_09535, partial [Planctomycetota bacterium]
MKSRLRRKTLAHRPLLLLLLTVLGGFHDVERAASAVPQNGPDSSDQKDPELKVLEIYVRESELSDLLDRESEKSFQPVEIGRLRELLQEKAIAEDAKRIDIASVREATYIAKIENEEIVSDRSRFVCEGKGRVTLGKLSFALSRVRVLPAKAKQFVDYQRASPGGEVSLDIGEDSIVDQAEKQNDEYWFGFRARKTGVNSFYSFTVPVANSGFMLLSAPESILLTSNEVIVEQTGEPRKYLPENWPNSSDLDGSFSSSNNKWWVVHLGGVSQFTLETSEKAFTKTERYRHVISKCQLNYEFEPGQLRVRGQFDLRRQDEKYPLRLRVSSELRVASILWNGESVPWRIQPSTTDDAVELELLGALPTSPPEDNLPVEAPDGLDESILNSPTENESDSVLEVVATSNLELGRGDVVRLPELSLADGFVVDGNVSILSARGRVIQNATSSSGAMQLFAPKTGDVGTELQTESRPSWSVDWLGASPRIEVTLASELSRWEVSGLHQLDFNPRWIYASSVVRVQSANLKTNEVRIRAGAEWIVDDAVLEGEELTDIQVSVLNPEDESQESEIVLNWSKARESLQFDLRVNSHRPLRKRNERIRRILTIPEGSHLDNYVLNPEGGYRLNLNANLLLFQKQPEELPVWQQELLKDASPEWIFQGVRRTVPPIQLTQSPGRFASESLSFVRRKLETSTQLRVSSKLRLEPESAAITNFRLLLPSNIDLNSLQVRLGDGQADLAYDIDSETEGSDDSIQAVVYLLEPQEETLEIQVEYETSDTKLGWPKLPFSISEESMLLLPNELVGNSKLDELPEGSFEVLSQVPSVGTGDSNWSTLLPPSLRQTGTNLQQLVACRLVDSSISFLKLEGESKDEDHTGWIAQEELVHRVTSSAEQSHSLQWLVQAAGKTVLKLQKPEFW